MYSSIAQTIAKFSQLLGRNSIFLYRKAVKGRGVSTKYYASGAGCGTPGVERVRSFPSCRRTGRRMGASGPDGGLHIRIQQVDNFNLIGKNCRNVYTPHNI